MTASDPGSVSGSPGRSARTCFRTAAGNRRAFAALIDRYKSLVCAVAYNATGDLGASEDLAQETFLTAWSRLDKVSDSSKLRAWLCAISQNLALRWLR